MTIHNFLRRTSLGIATAILGVVWSASALADTGGLQIIVTDADGNPVAGAQIRAETSASLTKKTGVTGENGEVRLMGLDPADDYVVTVNASGYQAIRNEGVLVVSNGPSACHSH